MLRYRDNIQYFNQEKDYSCGAASIRCILDASEEEIRKLIRTNATGTTTIIACNALQKKGIDCNYLLVENNTDHLWWVEQTSFRWPIYMGCSFKNHNGGRGRPSVRHHAVLVASGMIYDPANCYTGPEPIELIHNRFNKEFSINSMILFNHELKNWKKNILNHHG
jgi:hypothetical protein